MILQNLDALEKDLKSATDRKFYLIMGADHYQCGLAVKSIKAALLSPEGEAFDSVTYSAKETSSEKIFETANTFPMVSKRRLVIVTEFENLAEYEHEKFLDSLDLLPKQSLMVLIAEELDRRKKIYKSIQNKGCVVEFPQLKGVALVRWVEAFARKRGYRISSSMAGKIADLSGSDLQALTGEMEKLFLFAGEEKRISEEAVEKLVRNSRQHGIFELIDAVGRRDRSAALASLENLLSMGLHPLVVVTMMARHSRQVLIVKDCLQKGMKLRETGSKAQIPAFMVDQFIRQARTMDTEKVRRMHTGLYDIDRRLKSSSIDARALLEVFICTLV